MDNVISLHPVECEKCGCEIDVYPDQVSVCMGCWVVWF